VSIKISYLARASKIQSLGLLVTVASLPWSPFGTSLGMGILALSWVFAVATKSTLKPSKNLLPKALIAGFIWCALGVLWSSDFAEGIAAVNIKLPMLIVPLAMFYVPLGDYKTASKAFLISSFLAALTGIFCGHFISPNLFSPFISHIRMGLILALGSGILLLNKKWLLSGLYIAVALTSVWFTRSVTGLGMIAFSIFFSAVTTTFPKHRTATILASLFAVFTSIYITIGALMPQPFSGTLEDETPWGGKYTHYPHRQLEENGNKVWVNLAVDEMRPEWNLKSSVPFDSTDAKGHSIQSTLIRFLTSQGKLKNGEVVKAMSDEEISSVEAGHTSIRELTHSGLSLRLDDLKFEIGNYLDGGSPDGNSVTMRFEAYRAAWHIIKKMDPLSKFIGVGTGDLPNEFKKSYVDSDSALSQKFWIRTHNQYIAWWVGCGLIGLALWLIALYGSWIQGGDISRLAWWIVAVSCLAEDTLETQAGVTFAVLAMVVFGLVSNKKN